MNCRCGILSGVAAPHPYAPRILDADLDQLLAGLPAVAIDGAKGVGKTATALRRARTVHQLDDPAQRAVAAADARRLTSGQTPILIDEWQRLPEIWDIVRRAVDAGATAGSFLLTGSAAPSVETHSGAARIVTVRMRPLTLAERGVETPSISLAGLLGGGRPRLDGNTAVGVEEYAEEIVGSGFPGLRGLTGRLLRAQLDGYVAGIVEHDLERVGAGVRDPGQVRRWLTAYAAASSTTATYERIRTAVSGADGVVPTRKAATPYRVMLERLWVIDPVPAWLPTRNHLRRLASPPKHQLVDPALAARLLGVGVGALLDAAQAPVAPRDATLLGALFESLVTLDVRVYAQAAEATTHHLRTAAGEHEVDLVVVRDDGRVVAIEVKLARTVADADVRHLRWLSDRLGEDLLDAIVVTTGETAYRRPDGIGVVPAALLGA